MYTLYPQRIGLSTLVNLTNVLTDGADHDNVSQIMAQNLTGSSAVSPPPQKAHRPLTVVSAPPTTGETVGKRVRALQAEAKQLAKDHVRAFAETMTDLETLATEIATGGDSYPAGVRELARQLAEDLGARVQTLEAIQGRAK